MRRGGRARIVVSALGTLVTLALAAPAQAITTADFTCSPSCSVVAGTTVHFSATSDASSVDYFWDFGLAAPPPAFSDATGTAAVHQFVKPGTYTVGLRATDTVSKASIEVAHQVVVTAPTVDFTCSPSCTVAAGTTVTFTATSDAVTPTYGWDLSGTASVTFGEASGATASRTFTAAGSYPIAVQVSDAASGLVATTG